MLHRVVPSGLVSTTELLGVAVPEIVVVRVVVTLTGAVMTTVGGATAVNVMGWLLLPPGPDAVTVSVFGPAGTVMAQAKVPLAEAVVVQSVTGPGPVMVTVLFGVAVPDTVGVSVVVTLIGAVTVTLAGAIAVKLVVAGLEATPRFVATAVIVAGPAGTVTVQE